MTEPTSGRAHTSRHVLSVLLAYAVLAIAMTWPLAAQLTVAIPTFLPLGAGDPNLFLWQAVMIVKSLQGELPVAAGQMLFWPHGLSPFAGYDGPLMHAVLVPLYALTANVVLSYNVFILACFVAAGASMYGLTFRLTTSKYAAAIAGFIYGFSPYMVVRAMQHPNLLMTFVLPLLAWSVIKFLDGPTKKRAVIVACAVLLTGLSSSYYLVGAMVFLGIAAAWEFRMLWSKAHRTVVLLCAALVIVAAALPSLPMLLAWSPGNMMQANERQYDIDGSRLTNMVLPHPFTNVFGSITEKPYASFAKRWGGPGDWEATSYFGLPVIAALLLAAVHWRKWQAQRSRFWLIVTATFTVLSMGTFIEVFGLRIPLPFDLLRHVFPFSQLRTVNRLFIFALMAAAVLAGLLLAELPKRLGRSRLIAVTIVLAALLLAERLVFPYYTLKMTVPDFYRRIAAEPGQFAIADLPIWYPGYSLYDYYQTAHLRPVVTGEYLWLSYRPEVFAFIRSNDLLQQSLCRPDGDVVNMAEGKMTQPSSRTDTLRAFDEQQVRYVIVHNLILKNDPACAAAAPKIRDFFNGLPHTYADGEITAYSVPDLLRLIEKDAR